MKEKKWRPWVYNPRPRSFGPENHPQRDRVRKIQKLIAQSTNGDGVYKLTGTTFRFTIAPELQLKLDGLEVK